MNYVRQYRRFYLYGCLVYTATLFGLIFGVFWIAKLATNNAGVWPIIFASMATLTFMIYGGGLGFLFQAVAFFIKRLSIHTHQQYK